MPSTCKLDDVHEEMWPGALNPYFFLVDQVFFFWVTHLLMVFSREADPMRDPKANPKKKCHHCDSRSQLEWDLAADFQVLA